MVHRTSQTNTSSPRQEIQQHLSTISSPVLNFAKDPESPFLIEFWKKESVDYIHTHTQLTGEFTNTSNSNIEICLTKYGRFGTVLSEEIIKTFDNPDPVQVCEWLKSYMTQASDDLTQPQKPNYPRKLGAPRDFELNQTPSTPGHIIEWKAERRSSSFIDEKLIIKQSSTPVEEDPSYKPVDIIYESKKYQNPLVVMSSVPLSVGIGFGFDGISYYTPATSNTAHRIRNHLHDFALVSGWPDEEINRIADKLLLLNYKAIYEIDAALSLGSKYPYDPEKRDYYRMKTILDLLTDNTGDFIFAPETMEQYSHWKDKLDLAHYNLD